MTIRMVKNPIKKEELVAIAENQFGSLVKVVVDIERGVMAIGGDLHADEEALLIEDGSRQESLWGINLYVDKPSDEWIEFDSMINVRPSQGNISRSVENQENRGKIQVVVNELVAP